MQPTRTSERDLRIDCPVFTSDNQHLGYVKEIRRGAFKIDAPMRPDYWLPSDTVVSAGGERVILAVSSDRLNEAKRGEPREEYGEERYRTRRYDETWRGPGPDYLEPGREWEREPREPAFSYGEWARNRPMRGRMNAWEEPWEAPYRGSGTRGYRPERRMEGTYQDDDRWNPERGEFGDAYGRGSRYRSPVGVEGGMPRYDRERGWGYQGQGGWSGRMGAPGAYSEPYGWTRAGSREAGFGGQPGRGYDRETWGESPWYDSEAPVGYSGRGPRSYARPDDSICEEVCERLTDAGEVDASDIEVKVRNGEVILKGSVDDREQRRIAEDIASTVKGVRDVRDHLKVRGRGSPTGAAVEGSTYLV